MIKSYKCFDCDEDIEETIFNPNEQNLDLMSCEYCGSENFVRIL